MSLLAGRLIDRFGAVALLRTLYVAAVGAFLLLSVTPSWTGVVLTALVMGFPLGLGNPVTNVLVGTRVPGRLRGTATGLKQAGVQVGALLIGLTMPPVAAAYGWRAASCSRWPPRRACWSRCRCGHGRAAAAPSSLPLPGRIPIGAAGVPSRSSPTPSSPASRPAPSTRSCRCSRSRSSTLPAQRAGLIVALLGLLGAVSRVAVGVLGDRLPRFWLWLAGLAYAGAAATLLLFPAMDRPGLVWAAVAGFGATAPAWQSAAMLGLMRAGDRDGRSAGVVIGGFLLGMVAGPLAFGRLTDAGGYAAGWWLVVAALAVAGTLTAAAAVRTRY